MCQVQLARVRLFILLPEMHVVVWVNFGGAERRTEERELPTKYGRESADDARDSSAVLVRDNTRDSLFSLRLPLHSLSSSAFLMVLAIKCFD